jgi:anti-sigma factor RsiW
MSVCLRKETLLAFADRELASDESGLAERHIAVCAACQQELESIRAASVKVNSLLHSLAPDEGEIAAPIGVIRIPYTGANARMRWTAAASAGVLVAALVLFVMIRRQHSAPVMGLVSVVAPPQLPSVEKKGAVIAAVTKPAHVGSRKTSVKMRQFRALDDGEPIETGMIYRVSLPASSSPSSAAQQSAKRIPAEVIVDEFGKVRAIRFLQ